MTLGLAASNWSDTTAYYVFALLVVQLLHAKEVHFCSFVTKSNQACIKYSPKCIYSFHWTATYGKTHEIIYKDTHDFTTLPLSSKTIPEDT